MQNHEEEEYVRVPKKQWDALMRHLEEEEEYVRVPKKQWDALMQRFGALEAENRRLVERVKFLEAENQRLRADVSRLEANQRYEFMQEYMSYLETPCHTQALKFM